MGRDETISIDVTSRLSTNQKKFQLIEEIRSLSADCLPSCIKANVSGVLANQLFGRSVANFFNLKRV
ncbi:hypothetical protein [Peribacillus simplex]|uniref:hypothetical protein n=1 Tax=Peribacillus simplex TaxID=1478 RepID=UPI003D2A6BBC